MGDQHATKNDLIEQIMREARSEAEKLRSEAARSAEDRRRTLERRLAEIERDAEKRINEERDRLGARTDGAIALAEQRARLRMEDRIYRAVEARTREAMGELRPAPGSGANDDYRTLLRDWIVEAAIGLGAREAIVSCPVPDRDTVAPREGRGALDEATSELERLRHPVSLSFDAAREESGQGVVLRDSSGRRAFSNLVRDRIRRFRSELQRIVYHTVIEGQDGRTDHR
jgi:vacuolar-type H+-ATPase subunit E/Vma4